MKQEVQINNWEELKDFIQRKEVNVRWQIKSDIGPGWIGRVKSVSFISDNSQFGKNRFYEELVDKLITSLSNLEKHKDHVLDGKGKLLIEDNTIKFQYSWEGTIPYQYPDIEGKGVENIYTLK